MVNASDHTLPRGQARGQLGLWLILGLMHSLVNNFSEPIPHHQRTHDEFRAQSCATRSKLAFLSWAAGEMASLCPFTCAHQTLVGGSI